jgi:hypothetical protein
MRIPSGEAEGLLSRFGERINGNRVLKERGRSRRAAALLLVPLASAVKRSVLSVTPCRRRRLDRLAPVLLPVAVVPAA